MLEAFETMYINDPVFCPEICHCYKPYCRQGGSCWYACIHVRRRARADTKLGSLVLTNTEQSGVHIRIFCRLHCIFRFFTDAGD